LSSVHKKTAAQNQFEKHGGTHSASIFTLQIELIWYKMRLPDGMKK
jgi:hypothetical protein